jgi:hypothetical protein
MGARTSWRARSTEQPPRRDWQSQLSIHTTAIVCSRYSFGCSAKHQNKGEPQTQNIARNCKPYNRSLI